MNIDLEQFLNCHVSKKDEELYLSCLEVVVESEHGFSDMYFDRARSAKEGFGDTYRRVAKGGWFFEDIDDAFYPDSEMIVSLLGRTFSLANYAQAKNRYSYDEIVRIYSKETEDHKEFYVRVLSNIIHKYVENQENRDGEDLSVFFERMDSEIEEILLYDKEFEEHYSVESFSTYWNNYLDSRYYRRSNLPEDFKYIKKCIILKRQREYIDNLAKHLEDNRVFIRFINSNTNRENLLEFLKSLFEEESDTFKNFAYIDLNRLNKISLARRMINESFLKE